MSWWQRYSENSEPADRVLLFFLVLPALFCLAPIFRSALPYWLLGFFQCALTVRWFRQYPRQGVVLLGSVALGLVAGNALLQYSYLSSVWTYRIIHGLWFWMGVPAGLHFFGLGARSAAAPGSSARARTLL